jgi:hypothetical protein
MYGVTLLYVISAWSGLVWHSRASPSFQYRDRATAELQNVVKPLRIPLCGLGTRFAVPVAVNGGSPIQSASVPGALLLDTTSAGMLIRRETWVKLSGNTSSEIGGPNGEQWCASGSTKRDLQSVENPCLPYGPVLLIDGVSVYTVSVRSFGVNVSVLGWETASAGPVARSYSLHSTPLDVAKSLTTNVVQDIGGLGVFNGLFQADGWFGVAFGPQLNRIFESMDVGGFVPRVISLAIIPGNDTGVCGPAGNGFQTNSFLQKWSGGAPDEHSNASASVGSLFFGGFPPGFEGKLLWSERTPVGANIQPKPMFPIYNLQACGINIFSGISSHWFAEIDTTATCMTLPGPFFDALMAWLPSTNCGKESIGRSYSKDDIYGANVCDIPEEEWNKHASGALGLPWLSFQLSTDGPLLHFPLEVLAVPTSWLRSAGSLSSSGMSWCIIRDKTDIAVTGAESALAPTSVRIGLGTMVARHFVVAYDVLGPRVGLAPLYSTTQLQAGHGAYAQCALPQRCTSSHHSGTRSSSGMKLHTSLNTCLPPQCSAYLFQQLDEPTQQCIIPAPTLFLALLCVLGALVLECVIWERRGQTAAMVWARKTRTATETRTQHTPLETGDVPALHARVDAALGHGHIASNRHLDD